MNYEKHQKTFNNALEELPMDWNEFFQKNFEQLKTKPAAVNHHHNFVGGLMRHIAEMLDFAMPLAETANINKRSLIKVILLHDFAKLVTYDFTSADRLQIKYIKLDYPVEFWTTNELAKDGLSLTDEEINALVMAEGGWTEYEGIQSGRLANLLHIADLWSAGIIKPKLSVTCPDCGADMAIRKGPRGEFYGCIKFPGCRGIVDATAASLTPKENMVDDWIVTAEGGGKPKEDDKQVAF